MLVKAKERFEGYTEVMLNLPKTTCVSKAFYIFGELYGKIKVHLSSSVLFADSSCLGLNLLKSNPLYAVYS